MHPSCRTEQWYPYDTTRGIPAIQYTHGVSEPPQELGINGHILRVMLACPSDITRDEIEAFFDAVHNWNLDHAEEYAVALVPKHWSTHAHPRLGGRAQGVINQQLADKADILIALFWTRLGTDTGVAESGTVEEIMEFHHTGRPVKLYFSDAQVGPGIMADQKALAEFNRLDQFKKKAQSLGLYGSYTNVADLTEQLDRHLMQEVRDLLHSGRLPRRSVGQEPVSKLVQGLMAA